MNNEELQLMMSRAIAVARRAGACQLENWRTAGLAVEEKGLATDIVTQVDKACEAIVLDAVSQMPGVGALTEESGEHNADAEWLWVVDPLDGTTNYNAGLSMFNISIGIRHSGRTVGGVVYAPVLDELFTGTLGGGAQFNGKPLAPLHHATDLARAVVATGFPVDKAYNPDNNLAELSRVMPRVRGVRRLGSAAIDICYVAAGYLDAYWELNLHEWDVCAAELIAAEAGAVVRRYREGRNVTLMAAAPGIADELLQLLTDA